MNTTWEVFCTALIETQEIPSTEASPDKHVILYHLVKHLVYGNDDIYKGYRACVLVAENEFQSHSIFLCHLFSMMFEEAGGDSKQRGRLLSLVSMFVHGHGIGVSDMIKCGSVEILDAMGMIQSVELFMRKMTRINTSLHYKQNKYNLFREELEGYSRLQYFLMHEIDVDSDNTLDWIVCLIGMFDLDPNRVVQMVLANMMINGDHRGAHLVRDLGSKAVLPSLVGLMKKVVSGPSEGFARLIGILVREECVDIDEIYPYFTEDSGEIVAGLLMSGMEDLALRCLDSPLFSNARTDLVKSLLLSELGASLSTGNVDQVTSLLWYVDDGLCLDESVFGRVIDWIEQLQDKEYALGILVQYVIPSLGVRGSEKMVVRVWQLMAGLPEHVRDGIYDEWKKLSKIRGAVCMEARRWIRRLSMDNAREIGEKLKEKCRGDMLSVVSVMMESVMSYESMIEPLLLSLESLDDMARDMMGYQIVNVLKEQEHRERMKEDGIYFCEWIVHISRFVGLALQRGMEIGVARIVEYVMDRVEGGETLDLVVLETAIVGEHADREWMMRIFGGEENATRLWILMGQEYEMVFVRGRGSHVRVLGERKNWIQNMFREYTRVMDRTKMFAKLNVEEYGLRRWMDPRANVEMGWSGLEYVLMFGEGVVGERIRASLDVDVVEMVLGYMSRFYGGWTSNETGNFAGFLGKMYGCGYDGKINEMLCGMVGENDREVDEIVYMRSKNMLILLSGVYPRFPDERNVGDVERLCDRWISDTRDDLRVLAGRYRGMLSVRNKRRYEERDAMERSKRTRDERRPIYGRERYRDRERDRRRYEGEWRRDRRYFR